MSDEYFTHDVELQPGTKARAEDVNSRFNNIATGLSKLPAPHLTEEGFRVPVNVGDPTSQSHAASAGTAISGELWFAECSGSANAYILTMSINPSSYTAGLTVTFTANATNTGASTVDLGSLGVKQLCRFNGDPVQSGDIVLDSTYTAIYDGTKFVLSGSTQKQYDDLESSVSTYATNAQSSADSAQSSAESAGLSQQLAAEHVTSANEAVVSCEMYSSEAHDERVLAETAATAAGNSATSAGSSATSAGDSASLSQEWAESDEDVEVTTGHYSSLHWAAKASGFSDSAQGHAGDAEAARDNAGLAASQAWYWAYDAMNVGNKLINSLFGFNQIGAYHSASMLDPGDHITDCWKAGTTSMITLSATDRSINVHSGRVMQVIPEEHLIAGDYHLSVDTTESTVTTAYINGTSVSLPYDYTYSGTGDLEIEFGAGITSKPRFEPGSRRGATSVNPLELEMCKRFLEVISPFDSGVWTYSIDGSTADRGASLTYATKHSVPTVDIGMTGGPWSTPPFAESITRNSCRITGTANAATDQISIGHIIIDARL